MPRKSVSSAVEKVRESKKLIVDYLAENKNALVNGEMKVIVQEMVDAEYSAVLFTANPQSQLNEAVLVIGRGLGTGVVEDKVDVTTYYWNKTDKSFYYEKKEDSPVVDRDLLEEIFSIGDKVQKLFDEYMDVEISIKGREIFILQARPITTIEEGRDIVLDNSNISESYPGISLPATESFAKVVYYQAFKSCVEILAGQGKTLDSLEETFKIMVGAANGRMYYQISNWYSLLKVLPFSKRIIPIWQEMLGVDEKEISGADKVKASFGTKVKIGINFGRLMITTPKEMEKLNEYFIEVFPRYKEKLQKTNDNLELLELYKDARDTIGSRWGITLINDMYAFLYTSLAKKKHGVELGHIQMIESLKPVKALDRLVIVAQECGVESNEYIRARLEYLEGYGDRSFEELKLETQTMNTNPKLLDEYVKASLSSIEELYKSEESFINKDTLHKPDTNEKEAYFITRAKKGIYNRELSRMNRTRLFGFVRELLRKLGSNLADEGKIQDVEDIFWLYLEEIENCCQEEIFMERLISNRKLEYEGYKKLPGYSRLVFRNSIVNKKIVNLEKEGRNRGKSILQGVPSSKGIVSGQALVVENPSLNIDTKGKILIADITDPGWVFLIKNSKGIVTQRGSILSHTAIITRELNKPSVVGVAGVMESIKTGDYIRVNGEEGIVEIINYEGD